MDKVLVVKAVKPNYNTLSGGPPIMMVGGGGGGGRGGRTWREAIGGKVGGLVGVAGALAGQHRSLGSLAQSMISGGAQGAALGGGLGRRLVGRRGQALADLKEKEKQENAQLAAEHVKEFGASGSNKNLAAQRRSYLTGVQNREQQAAQQAKIDRARENAIAREAGAGYGREMREGYGIYSDLRDHGMVAGDITSQQFDNAMRAFNAREPMQGGNVRVDPSTQGSGMTAVIDAGDNQLAQGPQMNNMSVMQLPPPSGGANNEITQIENAGEKEALQTGTNHTGEYASRIGSLSQAIDEDENEEEDPSQQVRVVDNQRPPQGNRQQGPSTLRDAYNMDEGE